MKVLLDTHGVVRAIDPVESSNGWVGNGVFFPLDLGLTLEEVDVKSIPKDLVGRYRLVDGLLEGVPETVPAVEVKPEDVPGEVTMRQARLALLQAGLLDDVEAALLAIADAVERRAAQIEWEFATIVERNHPVIALIQAQQGLSDADIDALFVKASKI